MDESVEQFYAGMVDEYHLMFGDWRGEVQRQGVVLSGVVARQLGPGPRRLLDCTCGIGTQAIGLALAGHSVHATDLVAASVERARAEAASFGAELTFGVADVRRLAESVEDRFEVVLSGDNALAHLVSDEDLNAGIRQMAARLEPGGLLLATIRDYDRILEAAETGPAAPDLPGARAVGPTQPRATLPRVFDGPEGRRVVFQVWDWTDDARSYAIHQFYVIEGAGGWQTSHYVSRFRALRRAELTGVLQAAGLEDIRWQLPEASGFYQPIVTARAPRRSPPTG